MIKCLILVFFFFSLILPVLPAELLAKDQGEAVEEKTVEETEVDIHAIPPILDPEFRHKKKNQIEINPYFSAYLGNAIGQTFLGGIKGYYHFNNTFALGANWGISRLLTNKDSAFGRVLTNSLMQMVDAEFMISNDAAMRIGKTLMEVDFYLTLGIGSMRLNGQWQPMGVIGGGAKFYMGIPWLAFRIDINSYGHNVHQSGKNIVDFDVAIIGGPSILFPVKRSAYEQKRRK